MESDWKERLFKAIEADERSDRSLSLAAKLGPNFIGQMRGSPTKEPKEPSVQHVLRLAETLGLSPLELFAGTHIEPPIRTEPEILAFLARIEGLNEKDIDVAFAVISNAVGVRRVEPEPSALSDRPQPASRPREVEPSR